jgi:hypothetical protein
MKDDVFMLMKMKGKEVPKLKITSGSSIIGRHHDAHERVKLQIADIGVPIVGSYEFQLNNNVIFHLFLLFFNSQKFHPARCALQNFECDPRLPKVAHACSTPTSTPTPNIRL